MKSQQSKNEIGGSTNNTGNIVILNNNEKQQEEQRDDLDNLELNQKSFNYYLQNNSIQNLNDIDRKVPQSNIQLLTENETPNKPTGVPSLNMLSHLDQSNLNANYQKNTKKDSNQKTQQFEFLNTFQQTHSLNQNQDCEEPKYSKNNSNSSRRKVFSQQSRYQSKSKSIFPVFKKKEQDASQSRAVKNTKIISEKKERKTNSENQFYLRFKQQLLNIKNYFKRNKSPSRFTQQIQGENQPINSSKDNNILQNQGTTKRDNFMITFKQSQKNSVNQKHYPSSQIQKKSTLQSFGKQRSGLSSSYKTQKGEDFQNHHFLNILIEAKKNAINKNNSNNLDHQQAKQSKSNSIFNQQTIDHLRKKSFTHFNSGNLSYVLQGLQTDAPSVSKVKKLLSDEQVSKYIYPQDVLGGLLASQQAELLILKGELHNAALSLIKQMEDEEIYLQHMRYKRLKRLQSIFTESGQSCSQLNQMISTQNSSPFFKIQFVSCCSFSSSLKRSFELLEDLYVELFKYDQDSLGITVYNQEENLYSQVMQVTQYSQLKKSQPSAIIDLFKSVFIEYSSVKILPTSNDQEDFIIEEKDEKNTESQNNVNLKVNHQTNNYSKQRKISNISTANIIKKQQIQNQLSMDTQKYTINDNKIVFDESINNDMFNGAYDSIFQSCTPDHKLSQMNKNLQTNSEQKEVQNSFSEQSKYLIDNNVYNTQRLKSINELDQNQQMYQFKQNSLKIHDLSLLEQNSLKQKELKPDPAQQQKIDRDKEEQFEKQNDENISLFKLNSFNSMLATKQNSSQINNQQQIISNNQLDDVSLIQNPTSSISARQSNNQIMLDTLNTYSFKNNNPSGFQQKYSNNNDDSDLFSLNSENSPPSESGIYENRAVAQTLKNANIKLKQLSQTSFLKEDLSIQNQNCRDSLSETNNIIVSQELQEHYSFHQFLNQKKTHQPSKLESSPYNNPEKKENTSKMSVYSFYPTKKACEVALENQKISQSLQKNMLFGSQLFQSQNEQLNYPSPAFLPQQYKTQMIQSVESKKEIKQHCLESMRGNDVIFHVGMQKALSSLLLQNDEQSTYQYIQSLYNASRKNDDYKNDLNHFKQEKLSNIQVRQNQEDRNPEKPILQQNQIQKNSSQIQNGIKLKVDVSDIQENREQEERNNKTIRDEPAVIPFCVKKFIIFVTDSQSAQQESYLYQQLCQMLLKADIELLILQLNSIEQISEKSMKEDIQKNGQSIIKFFYSSHKLLQYLYSQRSNFNVNLYPLIIEHFQTNFLFVLIF